jgi:serine/threonine-protein kinase HipA
MKRSIQVRMGNDARPLGMLHYEQRGARERAAFEYDADWLGVRDRFTIDPTLQLVTGPQFHGKGAHGSVFHGAIADTEPRHDCGYLYPLPVPPDDLEQRPRE